MPSGRQIATIRHPTYALLEEQWVKALDVYDGSGGFLDKRRPYIVAHPREWLDHRVKGTDGDGNEFLIPNSNPVNPSPKLRMRWKLARYENISSTLIDTLAGTLFAVPPNRTLAPTLTDHPMRMWWDNADGLGTTLQGTLFRAWIIAAVFDHCLMWTQDSATSTTVAGKMPPSLNLYTPLDLADWSTDASGKLTAVKLLEDEPRTSLDERVNTAKYRVRVIDEDKWTLYSHKGDVIEEQAHSLGRLPVTMLYAKRRPLDPVIGKSVMGDPQLYIDFYNLVSEERELLRNQTFAQLNVPIGREGNAETERTLMGQTGGTGSVLLSTLPASFIEPSHNAVTAYHNAEDRLLRRIYRLAGVSWDSDTREVESAESKRLGAEQTRALLASFARELTIAETDLTQLVFMSVYGDGWERELETAQPKTQWPDTFTLPDFEGMIKQTQQAMALDLGETAAKTLKKDTAHTLLKDASQETLEQVDSEIDSQTILTAEEKQAELVKAAGGRMAQVVKKPQPFKVA